MIRWDDCHCEDFPCCGHYDAIEAEPSYCDQCGLDHSPFFRCDEDDDDDETDDEDVLAIRDAVKAVIDAHEEFDILPPWTIDIDYDRGEVFDE